MAILVTNIPPIECLIRKEFLYDHQSGHGDYLDCFWVTAKSIPSRALYIESYIQEYGGKRPSSFRSSSNVGLLIIQHRDDIEEFS